MDGVNGMFDNLSRIQGLQWLVGDSPEDLYKQLSSIRHHEVKIYAFYGLGNKHYVWFQCRAKIVKKTPKKKEE